MLQNFLEVVLEDEEYVKVITDIGKRFVCWWGFWVSNEVKIVKESVKGGLFCCWV